MKMILRRLLNRNITTVDSSVFTRNILIWILYPELRNKSFKKTLTDSVKSIVLLVSAIVLFTLVSWVCGWFSHKILTSEIYQESIKKTLIIDSLRYENKKSDSIIESLTQVTISRDYWNWKIISETGIKEVASFKKLPDSVFFTSIKQCRLLDIPTRIFFRVMERESKFQFIHNKTGSGAFGYMQVMPRTFERWSRKLDLKGGHTPQNNIIVASHLLKSCHTHWSKSKGVDSWRWALAEYACGRESLQRLGGIPDEVESGIRVILK